MAIITIARQYGAGARVVGQMVAKRLGYQLIDKAMLDQVAGKADVSVKQVEDIEKMSGDRLLLYHLVINTSLVDYDLATDLICSLVSAKEKL